jgi:hypothetical protein
MATMFVRHHVADYDAWRRVYDDFAPEQKRLGVVGEAVYQAVDDPNDITVTHDFGTPEAARAFAASTELHEAMGAAGVQGAPTIWFTNRA